MREQLTKSDVKKIEEEIEYRRLVLRKELIESVKEARAQGDLSENFEYHAAKKEKNKNESRIRYLERMLKTASVISDESKMDEVGLNNRVTVYFEDDDEEEVYKLVTSVRGNSLKNYISIELRELSVYNTILAALASGNNKLNDLFLKTGFSRAKISVYMKNLMAFDVVEKVVSFVFTALPILM